MIMYADDPTKRTTVDDGQDQPFVDGKKQLTGKPGNRV